MPISHIKKKKKKTLLFLLFCNQQASHAPALSLPRHAHLSAPFYIGHIAYPFLSYCFSFWIMPLYYLPHMQPSKRSSWSVASLVPCSYSPKLSFTLTCSKKKAKFPFQALCNQVPNLLIYLMVPQITDLPSNSSQKWIICCFPNCPHPFSHAVHSSQKAFIIRSLAFWKPISS